VTAENRPPPPSAAALRATFDSVPAYTVGIEDEVMLLDPDTLELTARAEEVLSLLAGDQRFKPELPASQLEIVTPPSQRVADAARALLEARTDLADRAAGRVLLAAAGVHPFSPGTGELNTTPRYEHTIREYGPVARRQLVCALQVHVSVGDADAALAVYNAARSYLPWLAGLAANAPFYEGRNTGLASVRPKLAELLPRQGVPPIFDSWEAYADTLRWGAVTGAYPDARSWWWELRLHREFGTLEFRVPDGQSTVADAACIAAVTQALVVWLAERHHAGESLHVSPTWQIEQNRWSACRRGVEGTMVDLRTGEVHATRASLEGLLETLEPVATRLEAEPWLRHAHAMVQLNGAMAQREAAGGGGTLALTRWLAERFREPLPG
jgi:carboxylate-amine ligase